jgi:uncharacterized protein (DUF427 family)
MTVLAPRSAGLQPREKSAPHLVNVLHSPKRIRVMFGGETIADSRNVLVLRSNHFLPIYFFPLADVRQDFLAPSANRSHHETVGEATHQSVVVGDRRAEDAAWTFPNPADPAFDLLVGHVAFQWKAMDHWVEEAEEVFVHAKDPYARVDTLFSNSHVQVFLEGEILADSRRPVLLFETHLPTRFYIPKEDVRLDRIFQSTHTSRCPYKGTASHWSAKLKDGSVLDEVAWEYGDPFSEVAKIKGLLAFYPSAVDEIRLDGERITFG